MLFGPIVALLGASEPAPAAQADDREVVELVWDAPAGCPERDAVVRATLARLPAVGPSLATPVRAVASIAKNDATFVLTLEIVGAATRSERTVRDPDCEAVADAAALILALAVQAEPTAPERAPSEEPAETEELVPPIAQPQAPPDETPIRESTSAAESSPTSAPQPPVVVAARVVVGAGFGALPQPGFELELAPWIARGALRVELPARWQPRRPARYPASPTQGADIGRWAIGPKLCGVPGYRRWMFPLCAGVEFGGLYGRGVDLPRVDRAHVVWGAALASVGLEYQPRAWFALVALGYLSVPFIRPAFTGDTLGVVHRASRVGGGVLLGIDFRWARRIRRDVAK